MSRERLKSIIDDFSIRGFISFFRQKSTSFAESYESLDHYDDKQFTDFLMIGEIKFDDSTDRLVIIGAKVNNELTDRSGKKAQYEKAKRILKDLNLYNAGIFIFYNESSKFRFSLVYEQSIGTKRIFNNFRRFTYFVSPEFTNRTFLQQIGDGEFSSLDNIKDSFSVEKVNKEFYGKIAEFFYELVGSEVEKGKYERIMKLPVKEDEHRIYQEFAVRLIGRTIFCWFLKYKRSPNNIPLIPNTILSSKALVRDYYHSVLEKLFFEVLNTSQEQRKKNILLDSDNIPFLNGGLFEPHPNDFYNGNPLYSLTIPDNWFTELLGVLEQYNFTIDENSTVDVDISVDPEMLGRIFENLLAEINPETGKTARKATGSYYTPRPIVEYMVDESLKQYLITKTNINEESIASLLSYETSDTDLNENEKDSVIKALDEIKAIDPACGSGAFPMGILQKMLLILQKVDPESKKWLAKQLARIDNEVLRHEIETKLRNENWDYVHKLGIIQNSIYGVDIQPIAVDISRLRFFLSLIVDEKIDDDKPNRGVEPLPNLEFKFVSANSLIGLGDQPILETPGEFERLRELRNEYLNSSGGKKKHIEDEFRAIQMSMFKRSLQFGGKDSPTLKISSWDPFSDEKSDWFDSEWMFGIKDGFDIVIGNPPYKVVNKIEQTIYYGYSTIGASDLYAYFFEKSIKDFLKDNGSLSFITASLYLKGMKFISLRDYLVKNINLISLQLQGDNAFENVQMPTAILIGTKHSKVNNAWSFEQFIPNYHVIYKVENQVSLLSKISSVMRGFEIGRDQVFPKGSIKFITGSNVKKWAIKNLNYISKETEANYKKNESYFDGERVLIRETGSELTSIYLEDKLYCNRSLYSIKITDNKYKPKYLVALLNSKLLQFYYQSKFKNETDLFPKIRIAQVNLLPIKYCEKQRPFIEITDQILAITKDDDYLTKPEKQSKVKEYEHQIDEMVYELYGLTPAEIAIVEGRGE